MLAKVSACLNSGCKDKTFAVYGVVGTILLLLLFCLHFFGNKTLIWSSDGFDQWFYNFCYLHDILCDLFSGKGFAFWSWQVGLGSDTLSFLSTFLFNPFAWVCALFPKENMEECFNLVMLIELFAAGFSMCAFLKHRKAEGWVCVAGALAYVFSYNTLQLMNEFIFLFPAIMFPLILLGIDFVFEGRTPALLMAGSAFMSLNYLYFAYMIVIVCLIYVVLKTIFLIQELGKKYALKRMAEVFFFTVCAMLIVSPFLLPCVFAFFQISTASSSNLQILPLFGDIFSFLPSFLSTQASVENGNHPSIGIFSLFVLLIPMFCKRAKNKCIDSVMFFVLATMAFLPFLRQLMNGGSYPASRFWFMLVFFTIVSASNVLTEGKVQLKRGRRQILTFAVLLLACEIISVCILSNGKLGSLTYLSINIILGFVCYVLIVKSDSKNESALWLSTTCVALVALLVFVYSPAGGNRISSFMECGKSLQLAKSSAFKNSAEVSTEDFSRIDTKSHARGNHPFYTNDSLYYNVASVSSFTSMINKNWLKFNKTISNDEGYTYRVASGGNDNRPGIDYLLGVKNFYLDENNRETSSAYAGSYFKKSDDENVMTSKYIPSLGYIFGSTISESEFEKLDAVQKEQALLQAVVVDDDQKASKTSDLLSCSSSTVTPKIKSDSKEISENKIEKNTKSAKKLSVEFENKYENYDIYLVVKNLHKKKYSKIKEYKIENGVGPSRFKKINLKLITPANDEESFRINVSYGKVTKKISKLNSNQALENMGTYVTYLGDYDGKTNSFNLSLSDIGTYSWDSIEVIEVPKGALNDSMQNMQDNSLDVINVKNDYVSGSVNAKLDGVLFLSVIHTPGWKVYVDGQQVDTFTADVAFTGCNISSGEHTVEMVYTPPFMKVGCVLSVFGVLLLVLVFAGKRMAAMRSSRVSDGCHTHKE